MTAEEIAAIADEAEALGLSEPSLQRLRERHPGVHFTYCMDDDLGGRRPYLERGAFNVYLVDGREHCLKVTPDLAGATGVVLAEVIRDDG
jgi:hypothetical protein